MMVFQVRDMFQLGDYPSIDDELILLDKNQMSLELSAYRKFEFQIFDLSSFVLSPHTLVSQATEALSAFTFTCV